MSATVSPGGSVTTNNTASRSTPVVFPDLTVALTGPASYSAGGVASVTATVSNLGVAAAPGPVTLTIVMPVVSPVASGTNWTCGPPSTVVSCTHPGPVPAGGTLPDVTVTGTASTFQSSVSMSATVSPGGSDTTNNTASRSTPIVFPDLSVVIGDGDVAFTEGSLGQYTVSSQNLGPGGTRTRRSRSRSTPS